MNEEEKEVEQTPQRADGHSAQEIIATFAEATASVDGETTATEEDTFLPMEAYSSSRFVPNIEMSRPVKVFAAPKGGVVVRLMRTGSNESNGCFIKSLDVSAAFKADVDRYADHTQVSLKLANGKFLTGYVSIGKSRRGFYFPKYLAEAVVPLPPQGKRLPVKTSVLIIG